MDDDKNQKAIARSMTRTCDLRIPSFAEFYECDALPLCYPGSMLCLVALGATIYLERKTIVALYATSL